MYEHTAAPAWKAQALHILAYALGVRIKIGELSYGRRTAVEASESEVLGTVARNPVSGP